MKEIENLEDIIEYRNGIPDTKRPPRDYEIIDKINEIIDYINNKKD